MMSGRIQMEELAVQLVGHPGNRMPVCFSSCGKGPLDGVPVQALRHVWVVGDVVIVVIIGKGIVSRWIVERQRDQHQDQAKDEAIRAGSSRCGYRFSRKAWFSCEWHACP